MGDEAEDEKETYEEVKAAVEPEEPEEAEPEPPKPKPKAKPKAKPKPKEEEPEPRKAGKNDKVECADCGKTMSANTLRYKHVCKAPKSEEIQQEKPRKRAEKKPSPQREPQYSPSTPRTKMVQYYREAKIAQQEQKRARYRSWLGND